LHYSTKPALKTQLPSDWIFVKNGGEVEPADSWPARFSYDAIRIPLYLSLSEMHQYSMDNFRHFWANYSRNATPAWWMFPVTGRRIMTCPVVFWRA
jgi:endo-1,4-beta-D-glucanase Y